VVWLILIEGREKTACIEDDQRSPKPASASST
jgi:hypothetical protein